jgi:trehalose 6-phosphate synthase
MSNKQDPLIVIVSNRGPFSFEVKEDNSYRVRRGSGGLVTALSALAQKHDVLWVASAMSEADRQWASEQSDQIEEVEEIYLKLVIHDESQYQKYYNTISNPLLWFIQHQLWDIPRSPTITRQTWDAWENGYRPINNGFAEAIAHSLANQDSERPIIIFVQDYHLYLVPHYLREIVGDRVQIQPFIHIPWPGPDAWRILPADIRTPMLASLLQSNRVGFQTEKDAFNFVQTCRFYLPGAHSHGSRKSIEYQGRLVEANAYPISVDVEKVKELAEEPQTQLLKSQLINFISDRRLILRVDRIEPSKNILRGLEAYRTLLEIYPEHRGKVQMLALLVPSRMEVDEYQDYLQQIMAQAGMINAEFSDAFWEPVRIVVGDNYHRAIGAMQFYDVLLVNPIADGMNLVAKEGVLVNQRNGVLLLSEHAGAFYELGDYALTVSSFDVYGTAQAMNEALTMPAVARQERAEALRAIVEQADVRRWFYDQLEDALASGA